MEILSKENEFAKVSMDNENLTCLTKSKFINMGYYYKFSSPGGLVVTLPTREIKKIRIQSTFPVLLVFFIFAAIFIGAGILYSFDEPREGGAEGSGSALAIGIVLGIISLAAAFLFRRSKLGKLKLLYTNYKGAFTVLYASVDTLELQSLRQTIEASIQGNAEKYERYESQGKN